LFHAELERPLPKKHYTPIPRRAAILRWEEPGRRRGIHARVYSRECCARCFAQPCKRRRLFFLKVPYWPLIGIVSGFLSLLPYVGLPLAILPPVLAALAIPNKFTVILTI